MPGSCRLASVRFTAHLVEPHEGRLVKVVFGERDVLLLKLGTSTNVSGLRREVKELGASSPPTTTATDKRPEPKPRTPSDDKAEEIEKLKLKVGKLTPALKPILA